MSFIIQASRPSAVAAAMRCIATPIQARCFTVSKNKPLKETDHEPDKADVYERAKQEQLRKQKEGKNEWDPRVASQSEENVHADRATRSMSLKEMQEETAEKIERENRTRRSNASSSV